MTSFVTDAEKELVRKVLASGSTDPQFIDSVLIDYDRYRQGEMAQLSVLTGRALTELMQEKGIKELSKALSPTHKVISQILRSYFRYNDNKTRMAQTYQETGSWYEVLANHVYSDDDEAQESFIDYVEEVYKTKVKDVDHLQKLTGITELGSDEDTDEQAQENARRELQDTLINSKLAKYYRALETAIQDGAKYKDLLKIKPKAYGLPETWLKYSRIPYDQQRAIQDVISREYLLDEPGGLALIPSLRTIAEDLEAPYSVVMESYKNSKTIFED